MMKLVLLLPLMFSLSACLTTRSQLRAQNEKSQVAVATGDQAPQAVTSSAPAGGHDLRFQEIDSQFRDLNGRVEVVENRVALGVKEDAEKAQGEKLKMELMEQKIQLLQQAMVKLENEIIKLKAGKSKSTKSAKVGNYTQAERDFANKKWKKAIVNYQKYRDLNPKGRRYSEATYKIGICFSELGLKSEARVFFQEVVSKFPKSRLAKKSQYRLKTLK